MKNVQAVTFTLAALIAISSYWLPDFFYSYEMEKENYFFVKDGMRSLSWSLLLLVGMGCVSNTTVMLCVKGLVTFIALAFFVDAFDRIVMHCNDFTTYDIPIIVVFVILATPILWKQ